MKRLVAAALAAVLALLCACGQQKTESPYYLADGAIYKTTPAFSADAVTDAAEKLSAVCAAQYPDTPVFYAVVPDKNNFTASGSNYAAVSALFAETLGTDYTPVDLAPYLSLDSYYRTDAHWSQPSLLPLADALLAALGETSPETDWSSRNLAPFLGAYSFLSGLKAEPESLAYLTSAALDSCTVENPENPDLTAVYSPALFTSSSPYDVFLGGAAALIKISNPAQENGKRLVVFRDSYGSSLAPLLVPAYSEVLLVDLRYVASSYLATLVTFEPTDDVLLLYSEAVLNSYGALRA